MEETQKPKYCWDFQLGKCTNGEACSFDHVCDPSFYRKACRYFPMGRCVRGARCTYSHEAADIAADEAGLPTGIDAQGPEKRHACTYFPLGTCKFGDNCKFVHEGKTQSKWMIGGFGEDKRDEQGREKNRVVDGAGEHGGRLADGRDGDEVMRDPGKDDLTAQGL